LIEFESFKAYNAHHGEYAMNDSTENKSLFRQPSAWIPLVMSLAALSMILGYVAIFGIVHHQDEGAPARIFQLIMLAQLPIVGVFAFKWLPKRTAQALVVLALQALAWVIPIIMILWLESL
jgi:hypothetical protein